jgi:hypothetical protein
VKEIKPNVKQYAKGANPSPMFTSSRGEKARLILSFLENKELLFNFYP